MQVIAIFGVDQFILIWWLVISGTLHNDDDVLNFIVFLYNV